MNHIRSTILAFLTVILSSVCFSQASISTDVFVLRNNSPQQKFFTLGQAVQGSFALNEKESLYAWVAYTLNGRFRNNVVATARDAATSPASIRYKVRSSWRIQQLSLGWKHYFKGTYRAENDWNLYGTAGFGLAQIKVENTASAPLDTSLYQQPAPYIGTDKIPRLTFDLGLGGEMPIGADIYLYSDFRLWLPASDYPSPYLISNKKVPLVTALAIGLRVLIQ